MRLEHMALGSANLRSIQLSYRHVYPKCFVIAFGNFDLIGFHIAASALPINLGLGTNQPTRTPNKKYPITVPPDGS